MDAAKIIDPMEHYGQLIVEYAPHVAGALAVLIIGLWASNKFSAFISKSVKRKGMDVSLQLFFASLINVVLKVLVLITVAGMMGIQTTSFVAIMGAAGLAVGLALQGSLANFAGGVLVLVFKPYKVGDLVETNGEFGEVKEIQIFNTVILTYDNKTAIIPNGAVSAAKIINYTAHGSIRVNLTFQIEAETSPEEARRVITEHVFDKNPDILKTPEPSVHLSSYANGMGIITVHLYCEPHLYWKVYYSVTEMVRDAFVANHINLPIPAQVQITK